MKYDSESPVLDFKSDQFAIGAEPTKNEILKDLSAFANHPAEEDKFIIVGVVEDNGLASGFKSIVNLVDEAKYQQFVHSNIEPPINFEYRQINFQSYQLAYFRIFNNHQRPYLFKKDVINPATSKPEYRVGDGLIRHGTSTRKLTRDDMESIYKKRYTQADRKSDLRVSVSIMPSDDDEVSSYDLDCVDVSIENVSTRSINLDVEMKVFTSEDNIQIIPEHDFKKELRESINEKRRTDGIELIPHYLMPSISLSVFTQRFDGYLVASLNRRLGEDTPVMISQSDRREFVFEKSLLVLATQTGEVKGEVTIRSDDFSEGPLILPFSIAYSKRI